MTKLSEEQQKFKIEELKNLLQSEVESIKQDIEILKEERQGFLIDLAKQIPLYTRFKIFLENEYLNLTVKPDTCCNHDEFKKAEEWSKRVTEHLLYSITQWVRDSKPDEKIFTKEDFESWINIRKENKESFDKYLREYKK